MQICDIQSTLDSQPEGTFLDLVAFNGQQLGGCRITGTSPVWEMHPDTDEMFYVLDGEFEITLLQEEEPTHFVASKGSVFVVPKGIWHKPAAPNGASFMYLTPGTSLHSDAIDPRKIT